MEKVIVQPFQTAWAQKFKVAKQQLQEIFKDLELTFHHIGSTSIPNCSAKPIIDVLGVTTDVTEIDRYNEAMMQQGYAPKGEYGMRQRRYFQKRSLEEAVNLHIFEDTNPETERHLRFCAYLRRDPEKTEEYSQLKLRLAQQFPHDIQQYILGKEQWIKTIDKAAAEKLTRSLLAKKKVDRKSEWSLEEILRAMEANMHLHMTYFAKYLPVMELIFEPDVTVVRTDIPDDTFNYVLFAKFDENNVHQRVMHVLSLYRKDQLPFSWWVSELDTPPQLDKILLQEGLVFKEENVGMFLDLRHFQADTSDHALDFRRVNSVQELKDFYQVIVEIGGNSQAFDLIYKKLPPVLYQEGASFEIHVAYLNRVPIVTGILLLDANVAGIYYIITIPSQRKHGYGTAMMEYLLTRAKNKGYVISTLQASQQGKSLYKRLGFQQCCVFKEYAEASLNK